MGVIMDIKNQIGLSIKGRIRPILRDAKTNKIVYCGQWAKNIIPNVGLTAIVNRLGNIAAKANEGIITYGAVGSGSHTPISTDTQMNVEEERKLLATTSVTAQTLFIEAFYTSAEANATLTQFALFGEDASGAADSGTMFEYADFASSFTKTSNDTLTVEIEITTSNI